ncbi:DUF1700 domain-containing protein [Bacillus cereus group sp. BfR-BA-01352]|uniref:DUF1700 domain-containing protein n=1 Tax=Bacillus cereus group sp. BfR-BA-01352 TaxID=2920315 RepID=UPI001F5A9956|nr:DUF1700 domain-containing protein [Bacillus cereus group sp. BfR-BA-01352]
MTISAERKYSRLMRLRRICGYGAAISVAPYLLIKILWTFGLFLPTEQMGDASWRIINAVTAVLAAIGIFLAMAFCRPWGERLPAWLVALPLWVGTGLLVPMLLIAPFLGPAAMIRDQEAGATDFWIYEQIFVMISLFGIGIFLPLALAGYAMARWPEALSGTTDYKELPGNTLQLQIILTRIVATGCILLGVIKVFWAVGGSFGIDPATMSERDVWWHLLSLSTGVWSFAGAWGILVVVSSSRRSRWFLPPMTAAWISSGALFSNNLYSALSSVRLDAPPSPEYPLAWLLTTQTGIVLGIIMGMIILLVLHERRRALRDESNCS